MAYLTKLLPTFVLCGLIGCSGAPTPSGNTAVTGQKDGKSDNAGESKTQTPKESKPEFTVSSDAILKEFIDNPTATDAKYHGKIVEVTGAVESLVNGTSAFKMSTKIPEANSPKQKQLPILRITVTKPNESVVARLSIGQKVKATGVFDRNRFLDFLVDINDCSVEELEPSSLQVLSSTNLASQFESDKAMTLDKYHGKELIVKGKLKRAWESENGPAYVKLGGSGKSDLVIQIGFNGFSSLKSIPIDHEIEIRTTCYRPGKMDRDDSGNEYFFAVGYLVPKK